MLSFFFEDKGPLLTKRLQQDATINAEVYCNTLLKLKKPIKESVEASFQKG